MRAITVLLLTAACGAAHAESYRLIGETQQTGDSDHTQSQIYYGDVRYDLSQITRGTYVQIGYGSQSYQQPIGNENFTAARIEFHEAVTPKWNLTLRGTQLWSNTFKPTLADLSLTYRPDDRWYFEFSADRALVDTVAAIRTENFFDNAGLSADYRLARDWTLVGSVLREDFHDGNNRRGGVGMLVYSPKALSWLHVKARGKRIDSDFRGVGYFSPNKLLETTLLLDAAVPVFSDRFVLTAELGGGAQIVNSNNPNKLYTATLGARGWFTGHFGVESKLGCFNTGTLSGAAAGGSYRYCFANVSLIGSW